MKESIKMNNQKTSDHQTNYDDITKKQVTQRMAKIKGQLLGIEKMVQKETRCNEIIIQLSSVQSAIQGLKKILIENHLHVCMVGDIKEGKLEALDEILDIFKNARNF